MSEPEARAARSARGGFVGAFVRTVRREQRRSAVGSAAVSTLVVVIVAAAVVGMGVLLKPGGARPADAASTGHVPAQTQSQAPGHATTTTRNGTPAGPPGQAVTVTGGGPVGVAGGPPAGTVTVTGSGSGSVSGTGRTAVTGSVVRAPATTATTSGSGSSSGGTKPKPTVAARTNVTATSGPGEIIGYGSGKCVDVTDGAFASNPQLQIWSCTDGPNQQWTFYSDRTVRAGNRCLTIAGGSTANGAHVLLSSCSSGSAAQQFTLNSAHDLVNTHADKCVDVVDQSTADGAKLQLWACGGTSNQKWHL
ncbi:RICIN domain-containing protein [Actinoplanes sp. TBRC 11911]|uniref:RICIN domain-containing protein n=1 Tax=Actinoplanes sp. TBRC 11911 TaxID=2729386 RepID=UPI00145E29CF|nr:RICIN domain-containing protein [Actinoplanes sp. TBRC 11911]NMO54017.1 RICIN domain-containing protein [Actinoplanes sp. TBRC 11911]